MAVPRAMVTVAEARERARKRVDADQRDWAATGGEGTLLEIVLRPPTESVARADQRAAISWVGAWRAAAETDLAATVEWGQRHWPSIGTQTVPERVILRGADAIAVFAGAASGREWRTLRDRAARLRAAFGATPGTEVGPTPGIEVGPTPGIEVGPTPGIEVGPTPGIEVGPTPGIEVGPTPGIEVALAASIRSHGRTLQRLADADFATLIDVVTWLTLNPASGWRIRQLPIRGIDTKWLERHRPVVESLHAAVSGRESLGLRDAPTLLRVRFLDPVLRPGGLCDVTAAVDELATFDVTPRIVFVFENLETMFAMPELPGAVVVHGGGYAARRLRHIPWIQAGHIIYWGDLDSDGFAILHALRSGCADVTSVLMDEATLLAYRDLWVPEPKAATGLYSTLTPGEQAALECIRAEGNVRLEQERLPWAMALATLLDAASAAAAAPDETVKLLHRVTARSCH